MINNIYVCMQAGMPNEGGRSGRVYMLLCACRTKGVINVSKEIM
jgi:hypothetical protein